MTHSRTFEIHPKVFDLVEEYFPGHPTDDRFWRHIAAEVSDGFRPDIEFPDYELFLKLKLDFAINGPTDSLFQNIDRLSNRLLSQSFAYRESTSIDGISLSEWLNLELGSFELHAKTESQIHDFENVILNKTCENDWRFDPSSESPREISRRIAEFLKSSKENWEGLHHSLIVYILRAFPERDRDTGFWRRIPQQIGNGFDDKLIGYTDYAELINLQTEVYGFHNCAEQIRSRAMALTERIANNPFAPHEKMSQEIEVLLAQIRDQRHRPPPDDGHSFMQR